MMRNVVLRIQSPSLLLVKNTKTAIVRESNIEALQEGRDALCGAKGALCDAKVAFYEANDAIQKRFPQGGERWCVGYYPMGCEDVMV